MLQSETLMSARITVSESEMRICKEHWTFEIMPDHGREKSAQLDLVWNA